MALENWVPPNHVENASRVPAVLGHLAHDLEKNHQDAWFSGFLSAASSAKANELLRSSIDANRKGDIDQAYSDASRANSLYLQVGNLPASLRSRWEMIYSLRRQSRATACLKQGTDLLQALERLSYSWLKIQTLLESSSCALAGNNLDLSLNYVDSAIQEARRAQYPNLSLRAEGVLGILEAQQGRDEASWLTNSEGLKAFWKNTYSNDRAFQFYHNLQVTADMGAAPHLTFLLHRETAKMIADGPRLDFAAMADIELAAAADGIADYRTEREELDLAAQIFSKLPPTPSRELHRAYCEIALARAAIRNNERQHAIQQLRAARASLSHADDLVARLGYLKTEAELQKLAGNKSAEEQALNEIAVLAGRAFRTLSQPGDRWTWAREVQEPYRRLLEIRLDRPHPPLEGLAMWESYRALESAGTAIGAYSQPPLQSSDQTVRLQAASLKTHSLIVFSVLPSSVRAWVVDNRGVKEFRLTITPEVLQKEVKSFFRLCSSVSAVEKVNASGSRLYQWLLAPLENSLDPSRGLSLEGDSFLTSVAWPALWRADGTYLGQSRIITSNVGMLLGPVQSSPKGNPTRVVIATPGSLKYGSWQFVAVPEVESGAVDLARLYPKRKWLRGDEATRTDVLKGISDAEIFHFGGHAITREGGGELIVYGESGGEAISAATLRRLRMKYHATVVLTACSTAAADRDLARNPNGLVQAFFQAGAARVMASRWDVDSGSSGELMKHFYSAFRTGDSAGAALQLARRQMIAQKGSSHPYYWAAFDLFEQGGN